MATYSLMVMPASSARARTTLPSGRAGGVTITSRSPLLGGPLLGLRAMPTPNRTYVSDTHPGVGVSARCCINMVGEPASERDQRSGMPRSARTGSRSRLHGRELQAGLPTSSAQQGEGFDVSWPHDGEVTAVE